MNSNSAYEPPTPPIPPIFSLLHPTDTLPSGWQQSMNEWLESCLYPQSVEYILCIDQGRERDLGVFYPMVRSHGSHKGIPLKLSCGFREFRITVNKREASPINAYNQAASIAQGRYLLLCSDHSDYPPPCWDQLILNSSSNGWDQIHSHLRSLCPLLVTRKEYEERGKKVVDVDVDVDKEKPLCRI